MNELAGLKRKKENAIKRSFPSDSSRNENDSENDADSRF